MRTTICIGILAAGAFILCACDSGEERPRPQAAPVGEQPAGAAPIAAPVSREAPDAPAPPASPPADNLLANPDFEAGSEGWSWRESSPSWSAFEIVDGPARSGSRSAHLPLRQTASDPWRAAQVFGVVQEPSPASFPTRLGGWYRVERWEKEPPVTALYLQVVVIVWGDPRTPGLVDPLRPNPRLRNYQLRYYLAGQPKPAFPVSNAKIQIVSGEPPALGEWVHFELPIAADFERLWGVVPEGFESLRLLFEARWDNLPAGGTVSADVYYDDLYVVTPPTAP